MIKARTKLLCAAAVLTAFMLGSCGNVGGGSGKHCTLTFTVSSNGSDIAGKDLGSGSYEEEFTVYKGTALTDSIGGGNHMKIQEKRDEYTCIEIKSIDENGVTYLLRNNINDEGEEIMANYGKKTKSHDTIVHDGLCSYRTMVFSDYAE